MRLKHRLLLFIISLIGLFLIWYLFLKSWDYQIYFTVKTQPAVVYQSIHDWNEWNGKMVQKDKMVISKKEPWKYLQTTLELNDTNLIFNWHINQKNDSITEIKVGVSDKERKLYNRVRVPFLNTSFKKNIIKNTLHIKSKTEDLSKNFSYNFIGIDSIAEVPCVYISTQNTVRRKAYEMMNYVIQLNLFVKDNNLGLNGDPMVLVNNWNAATDTIHFDFCFPILHPELMPEDANIKLKTVSIPKALKGNFYGNYSISDMAWYALFEEAEKNGEQISGQIIEVFYNDPHSGGNDLEWKAGIYLGIKN